MWGYPCKICGDFPVNSKLITCKSYIFFNAISTCVPKVRNYGDFRQHVIPTIITCMLRGTPCDTGFTRNFYRGNICSVQYTNMISFEFLRQLVDSCLRSNSFMFQILSFVEIGALISHPLWFSLGCFDYRIQPD